MECAIQFENVFKTFSRRTFKNTLLRRPVNRVVALRDVSLSIAQGQVFGLLGSNGAGKTTLVKLIAGLISPDAGRLKLFGQTVTEDQFDIILSHVGLVTNNERTFYWRLTGRQNLDFFGTLYNLPSQERKKTLNQLLAQMELDDIADRPFMTYSMGQKQRFAIARSLLNNPSILLFDEATTNLDPLSTKKLLGFVRKVLVGEKEHTILWCTHNLAEAERICDNIAIMHKGRIISEGTLRQLQARCSKSGQFSIIVQDWRSSLTTRLTVPPRYVEEQGRDISKLTFSCQRDMIPVILKELFANQVNAYQCTSDNLPLEDIFEEEIIKNNHQ